MKDKNTKECRGLLKEFFIFENIKIANSFQDKEDSTFIKQLSQDLKQNLKNFVSHHEGSSGAGVITVEIEPKNTAPLYGATNDDAITQAKQAIVRATKIKEAKIKVEKLSDVVKLTFDLKMPVSGNHVFNLIIKKQHMERSDVGRDIVSVLSSRINVTSKSVGHNEDARIACELTESDPTKKQEEIKNKKQEIEDILKNKYGADSVTIIAPGASSDSQSDKYDTYVVSNYHNEEYINPGRSIRIVIAIGKAASDAVEKMQLNKIDLFVSQSIDESGAPIKISVFSTLSNKSITVNDVTGTISKGGSGQKADMAFRNDKGEEVLHISLKDGDNAKKFQQWSGFSKFVDNEQFDNFVINTIASSSFSSTKGYEIIEEARGRSHKKWLVAKFTLPEHDFFEKIIDDETKKKAVYSHDDSVNAVFQSNIKSIHLEKIGGNSYKLVGDGQVFINPEIPTNEYEPVFHARSSDENVVIERSYAGGSIFNAVIDKIENSNVTFKDGVLKADGVECVGLKINGIRFFVYPLGKIPGSSINFAGESKDQVISGDVSTVRPVIKKRPAKKQEIKETKNLLEEFLKIYTLRGK